MVEKELICKGILESVLKEEFSSDMFSLDGYGEDSVCLKKEGNIWEVYIGFRGQKKERVMFDNVLSACLGVIELLTPHNENLRKRLDNMFVNAMVPDKII